MANKIFGVDMPAASLPLSGTETLSIMQDGVLSDCSAQDIADLGGGGGGGASWGSITGTLSDQSDLLAALNGKASQGYEVIIQATSFTATPGTHNGLSRYVRAGADVTFNSAQAYAVGQAYNIRATSAINLLQAGGFVLTPPAGGTLALSSGMSVQVIITGGSTADVIGQTVVA